MDTPRASLSTGGVPPRTSRLLTAAVSLALASLLSPLSTLCTLADDDDRSIAGNMTVKYLKLPGTTDSLAGMLSEGEVYGRLRSNSFRWDWSNPLTGSRESHSISGIGGSLVFKSANYRGFGLTLGAYGTSNPWQGLDDSELGSLKAGKDLVARGTGDTEYAVLAESFLQWKGEQTQWRFGRQLYESAFTASNDTKMIPNTFDGVTLETNAPGDVRLRAAWFDAQKLRDHVHSHDVLTFRDEHGDAWGNQDDAAVHRGLSYQNFVAAGQSPNNELWLAAVDRSFGRVGARVSSLLVPDVIGQVAFELSTRFGEGEWQLQPGMKFMQQVDRGGGAIGGASLLGNVSASDPGGYDNPDSLDGGLLAARVDLSHQPTGFAMRLGYTQVADEGDLVAPWRGFPTGGYTRAMGQYNWRADTRSWMLQLRGDLSRYLPWDGTQILARYADMDMDERKGMTDRTAFNVDLVQRLRPDTLAKFRCVFVNDDGISSYNEYRVEFNYLF